MGTILREIKYISYMFRSLSDHPQGDYIFLLHFLSLSDQTQGDKGILLHVSVT